MNCDNKEMRFSVEDGSHVLRPENELAVFAQASCFEILEKMQAELINKYDKLSDDQKIKQANRLSGLFVDILMNGDQASFKILLGQQGKGLMTKEELSNLKKDFEIAKRDKNRGDYKTFLLLDLLPYSNRRADAIVITNQYKIMLHDFSEGIVAEKLKNYHGNEEDLTSSEQKQLRRKNKQNARILSYKDKIDMNSSSLEEVIVDNKASNVRYYCSEPRLFDFNRAYREFLSSDRKRVYIPSSICFLSRASEHQPSDLFTFPLKGYIDSPYFTMQGRFIDNNFIEDVYMHDTKIIFSRHFFFYFFEAFTCFDIRLIKRIDGDNFENQIRLTVNKKVKGIFIEDSRTGKRLPLTYQLLFKHAFMNMCLMSWCEYMSALCNQTFEDKKFNKDSFYVDEVKNKCFFFNA